MKRFLLVLCLFTLAMTSASAQQSQTYQIPRREPVIGCLLSLSIPGAGQVYNEDYEKAVFFVGSYCLGLGMLITSIERTPEGWQLRSEDKASRAIAGFLITLSSIVVSTIDAVVVADRINKRNQQQHSHLIEFERDQFTLGIDPITSSNQYGTMLSLRF